MRMREFMAMAKMHSLFLFLCSNVSNTTSAICKRIEIFFLVFYSIGCVHFSFFISFTSRIDIFFYGLSFYLLSFVLRILLLLAAMSRRKSWITHMLCVHITIAQWTMCRTASRQAIDSINAQHLRIAFAFGHILDIGSAIAHMCTQTSSRRTQKKEVYNRNVWCDIWLLSRDLVEAAFVVSKGIFMCWQILTVVERIFPISIECSIDVYHSSYVWTVLYPLM